MLSGWYSEQNVKLVNRRNVTLWHLERSRPHRAWIAYTSTSAAPLKKGLLSSKSRCPVPVMVIDCCTKCHNDISTVRRYTLQWRRFQMNWTFSPTITHLYHQASHFEPYFNTKNTCISRPASNQACEYLKRWCLVIMWSLRCETLTRKRKEVALPPTPPKKRGEKEKQVTRCISKGGIAFCSGQIPLWSEGGTVGVAGIITGIMRWCSREERHTWIKWIGEFSNRLFEDGQTWMTERERVGQTAGFLLEKRLQIGTHSVPRWAGLHFYIINHSQMACRLQDRAAHLIPTPPLYVSLPHECPPSWWIM